MRKIRSLQSGVGSIKRPRNKLERESREKWGERLGTEKITAEERGSSEDTAKRKMGAFRLLESRLERKGGVNLTTANAGRRTTLGPTQAGTESKLASKNAAEVGNGVVKSAENGSQLMWEKIILAEAKSRYGGRAEKNT